MRGDAGWPIWSGVTNIPARELSGVHIGRLVHVGPRSFLLNEVHHKAGHVLMRSSTGAVYTLDHGNVIGVPA